ncbi:isoprenoid synthase domain-containing protein [Acrasis kona]|uniref:Isoprenoid synthase domain-containing protein n=1 Tax=Acrasis kona TaxID=1008807 RepID=A0AAW2ZIP9_9EUKA
MNHTRRVLTGTSIQQYKSLLIINQICRYSLFNTIKTKLMNTSLSSMKLPKLLSVDDESKIIHKEDAQIDSNVVGGSYRQALQDIIKHEKRETSDDSVKSTIDGDMTIISDSVLGSVKVDHPVLDAAAAYFFQISGKRFRPMLVLLVARAINKGATPEHIENIMAKQRKVAESTEIIHVASLIHDDIVDGSDTRRGIPSLNTKFGNKVAVLAGDFLLARSSLTLARLGNIEVVELFSTVIEHLSHGEVLQMAGKGKQNFDNYMRTIYFKTASLIAHSCKAAAVLSGAPLHIVEAAYNFGKHIGIAYQLTDDTLDFTQNEGLLGKPSQGADMRLGISTAPILYAAKQYPNEMNELISRKFSNDGDVESAMEFVKKSQAVEHTQDLAASHFKKAVDAALQFEPSPTRTAMISLIRKIMERDH